MTDETKHTPGPWSYRPAKYDDWGFVRAEPLAGEKIGHLVAVAKDSAVPFEMHEFHREGGTDPFEGNARLIAAAPEMLDALEACQLLLVDLEAQLQTRFATLGLVNSTIAKALGRSK